MRQPACWNALLLLLLAAAASSASAFVTPNSAVPVRPPVLSRTSRGIATIPKGTSTCLASSIPMTVRAARPILIRVLAIFLASFWAAAKVSRNSIRVTESKCPFLLFSSSSSSSNSNGSPSTERPNLRFYAWFLQLFGRRPVVTIPNSNSNRGNSSNQTQAIQNLEFVQTLAVHDANSGLLKTADGNRHAYLRRLLRQAFTKKALHGAVPKLQQVAEETLENVILDPTKVTPHIASVLVQEVGLHYTLDAIQCQWLGISLHREDRPILREILRLYTATPKPWWQPKHTTRQAQWYLKQRIENLIDVKKRRPDASTLSHLLSAVEFTDEYHRQSLTDAEVRDNTLTLIQAGAKSTANLLTTAIQWLGKNPQCYQQLVEEQKLLGHKCNVATLNKKQSPYLDAVIQETMRLASIPSSSPRLVTEEIELDNGKRIPRGWLVQWKESDNNSNNNNKATDEEELFNPQRWIGEGDNSTAAAATTVSSLFGVGPRACLGKDLSILHVKVFLATMATRIDSFQVTLDDSRMQITSPIPSHSPTPPNTIETLLHNTTATAGWLKEALETSPTSFA